MGSSPWITPIQIDPRSYNPFPTPLASKQAKALSSPADVEAFTAVNPFQQTAFDATKDAYTRASEYESGLAKGTNEEITREIGRYRDELSAGLGAEGEAAMARGADPSLFRSRALESGKRGLADLQGRLADVALRRREGALSQLTSAATAETGAAGAAASEQRLMHLGSLAQRLAEQRALVEQAEVQARLNAAPYDRLLSMMRDVGSFRDASYTGPTGGMVGGGSSGTAGVAGGVGGIF